MRIGGLRALLITLVAPEVYNIDVPQQINKRQPSNLGEQGDVLMWWNNLPQLETNISTNIKSGASIYGVYILLSHRMVITR